MNNKVYTPYLHKVIPGGYHLEYYPSCNLKPYIKRYYFSIGFKNYLEYNIKPIAKTNVEIHLHFNEKGHKIYDYSTNNFKTYYGYIVGNYCPTLPVNTSIQNELKLCVIELSTLGVIKILGVYPNELYNKIVDFHDVLDTQTKSLLDVVIDNKSISTSLSWIEYILSNKINAGNTPQISETRLIKFLDALPGLSVSKMCNELHINRRTIERIFSKRLGYTPKEYLKVIRLNKVCKTLSEYPNLSLTDIVYLCNYYDQSHFIKEFKQITHQTPLEQLKKVGKAIYLGRGYIVE